MEENALVQYQDIQKEIKQLEQQIDKLEALAQSPLISNLTGMPRSKLVKDGMDIMAKIGDLKTLYYYKLGKLLEMQKATENNIDGLESRERLIIRYKYINGLTNEKIADRVNWSQSTIKRRIKDAMQKLKGE